MQWLYDSVKSIDEQWLDKAAAYQLSLTKPPGALGLLEDVAVRFSAFQQSLSPSIQQVDIAIMAADHGIVDEGVSAFPQAVTAQMIENFSQGGAAISVLARDLGANLSVYNVGTVNPLPELKGVKDRRVAAGTQNICKAAAMTSEQLVAALAVGKDTVDGLTQTDVYIGGEMGIGNTSIAACIAARLLDKDPALLTGLGTGIEQSQLPHKVTVIQRALALHKSKEPIEVLRCLGGFEVAALVASYIRCAQRGIPVLIDGYISSAAALLAVEINPGVKQWLLLSHLSAEPGHKLMVESLGLSPLVQWNMRLGEGSGAALAVSILRQACLLQSQMASFDSAGVSEKL